MYLRSECEALLNLLKESGELGGCYIILAYPFAKKPTRLTKPIIAVSPAGLEGKAAEIGEERYFGEYTLCADIYLPQQLGSPAAYDIAERVIGAALSLNPIRIKLAEIESDDALDCFRVGCAFSFNGEISFKGGESDGQQG